MRFILFAAALLLSACSILSLGFVIASIVPTARFAQPIGTVVLYPMLARYPKLKHNWERELV